jgi:ribosomal protein S27AE
VGRKLTEWSKAVNAKPAEVRETPAQAKARERREAKRQRRDADPTGRPISEVGEHSAAGLACPKCGGTQFKAKRRGLVKAAVAPTFVVPFVGAAAFAAAPKSRVKCVTCGNEYQRG